VQDVSRQSGAGLIFPNLESRGLAALSILRTRGLATLQWWLQPLVLSIVIVSLQWRFLPESDRRVRKPVC
jgi:hypothetical protein